MTRLASRFGAANLIRRDRPLTREELFRVVPSVFSEDKHESRSERYTYIPTISLLDSLQREGFQPFFACQTRVRDPGRREHTKHMLRLRREGQITGKQVPEIILLNSHDGSSSYQMLPGYFRAICTNGLVCGQSFGEVRVPHRGNVVEKVIEGAYEVLEGFAATLPSDVAKGGTVVKSYPVTFKKSMPVGNVVLSKLLYKGMQTSKDSNSASNRHVSYSPLAVTAGQTVSALLSKGLDDGSFFFADAANSSAIASSAVLTKGTTYHLWVAVKDGGKYDLDGLENKRVIDPPVVTEALETNSGDGATTAGDDDGNDRGERSAKKREDGGNDLLVATLGICLGSLRVLDFSARANALNLQELLVEGRHVLTDDELLEEVEDLTRLGQIVEQADISGLGELLFDDLVAEIDALVADVHTRTSDQLLDLLLALSAERALQQVTAVSDARHGVRPYFLRSPSVVTPDSGLFRV